MDQLTRRQFEINQLIAEGYQVKEIADILYLSEYTVDTHIKNIKKLTGARNFADLTREFVINNAKLFMRVFIGLQFLACFSPNDVVITRTGRTPVVAARTAKTGRKNR